MKGKDRFTTNEAAEIRRVLRRVRRAEPGAPQKLLRDQLRAIGFFISDWAGGPIGFTASEFDELVRRGLISIVEEDAAGGSAAPPSTAPRATRRRSARTSPATVVGDGVALARAARSALGGPPSSIEHAAAGDVPDGPGLYALYADAPVWHVLGLGEPPDSRPLYVGKAEDSLVSRDLNTHFATGTTGRSSPRRSFAALLSEAEALELVAMPRRPHDPEPGKWTHYALEEAGDGQLTDWMWANLAIAVWPCPPGTVLRPVETALIQHWLPPLNLTGVATPWTAQVKAARAAMAAQAKDWARRRGFDV